MKARQGVVSVYTTHADASRAGVSRMSRSGYTQSATAKKAKANVISHREVLEKISKDLGVNEMQDWYSVSRREVARLGGPQLFRKHKSMLGLLSSVYPELEWDEDKFRPSGGGKFKTKQWLAALDKVEEKMGIEEPEDWYTVRVADLQGFGLPRLSTLRLAELLMQKYPDQKWEKFYLLKGKFALQKRLERAIATLFPGVEIKTNTRKESGILNPETFTYLELDVYVPSYQLALEFQERHHYISSHSQPLESFKKRDEEKKILVDKSGITLIAVPCWWDYRLESLAATIKSIRPDLADKMATIAEDSPIPESPPANFFDKQKDFVEDIGEPTNAAFFVNSKFDPTNWWIFEKYDGVRGFWNPVKKAFYSRKGRQFTFPQEVIDSMPTDTFLDGELWFGRDSFQEAMKITHRSDESKIDWNNFRYMVFDIPTLKTSYAERYADLKKAIEGKNYKYIKLAEYEQCKNMDHLEKFFQDVIDKGGEGIILRDPLRPYEAGTSHGYLKHKKFRDAEAKVVGNAGLLWECELPNGVRFTAPAGTTEFAKRWNPQPGDIVSFKHRGFLPMSLKPKLPALYRIRTDLSWEDVVHNWNNKQARTPTNVGSIRSKKKHRSKGYWKNIENRRNFFLEFAAEKGFDPYVAENWDKVTSNEIRTRQVTGLLAASDWHINKAIEEALGVKFQDEARRKPTGYWDDIQNRKKFFVNWAKELGFDPYVESNWRSITIEQLNAKGGRYLITRYGTLQKALQSTFTEMKFKDTPPREYWEDIENRKQFFIEMATDLGFDPYEPSNWANVTRKDFKGRKAGELLKMYNFHLRKALAETFTDVDFKISKPKGYWDDVQNTRNFFLSLAEEEGFDPNVPENWDKVSIAKISEKGGITLVNRFKGIHNALVAAFPELNLPAKRLPYKNYWSDKGNRQKALLGIAAELNFDPYDYEKWKTVPVEVFKQQKALYMLQLFNGKDNLLAKTFDFEISEDKKEPPTSGNKKVNYGTETRPYKSAVRCPKCCMWKLRETGLAAHTCRPDLFHKGTKERHSWHDCPTKNLKAHPEWSNLKQIKEKAAQEKGTAA